MCSALFKYKQHIIGIIIVSTKLPNSKIYATDKNVKPQINIILLEEMNILSRPQNKNSLHVWNKYKEAKVFYSKSLLKSPLNKIIP